MKPWIIWLLDPRPPWWRSTRVWLPLLIISVFYLQIPGILRLTLAIIVVPLFVLALARRWFEGMVLRRQKRLTNNTCPSCDYPNPGPICPECGIDVEHERTIVVALLESGFRGIQSLSS